MVDTKAAMARLGLNGPRMPDSDSDGENQGDDKSPMSRYKDMERLK